MNIIRLLKKKSRLVECAGLWSDIPDEELEEIEEGMREMRESLNSLDGLVAAISLTHGCNVIVTRNVKHFERIGGIEVEEY